MGLFNLFRKKESTRQVNAPLNIQKIFENPVLIALWVNKYFLANRPLSDDYDLLPDDDSRRELNITVAQRERCLREYSVLRIAGISLFIKQVYDDIFWLHFSSAIIEPLSKHLYADEWQTHATELAEVVDKYVSLSLSGQVDEVSRMYMIRLYDDNEKFIRMKLAGIGFIACDQIDSAYKIFKDTYDEVVLGEELRK